MSLVKPARRYGSGQHFELWLQPRRIQYWACPRRGVQQGELIERGGGLGC